MFRHLDVKVKVYRINKGKVVVEEVSLPNYTAADEGKVLGIVGGQPGWVATENGPVAYVESMDPENLLNLRDLESNTYVLKGRFRPYAGADSTMNFSSSLMVNIIKQNSKSSVQVFYPVNNCVQYLEITDSEYTRTNVYLNDLLAKVNGLAASPLLLDANSADTYLEDSNYGDQALEAIKTNRQILVRVPNADGGNYTAIYSPVLMHQIPNYQNNYLYLFFLRDEKQDLSQLGVPAQMPTYGELKMLLSQEYNSNPLEDVE